MFGCDLHTYSRFFHRGRDSVAGYDHYGVRASLWVARGRGLDGIAVTNHDFFRVDTVLTVLPF